MIKKRGIKKIEDLEHLSKADLHIHSDFSDGEPTIGEILEHVEHATDLDVIAITDHDTIDGALEAVAIAKQKKYRFEIIVGEEITTDQGHILGLFLNKSIKPDLKVHTVLKEIKEQGGIAIPSHPFMTTRWRKPGMILMDGIGLVTLLKERKHIDAVEVVNATPTLTDENIAAAFINRTVLLKAEVGNSDAHILEAIGKGYTLFEGKGAKDLKEAIRHRQTQAMSDKWTVLALFRYLFFFVPKAIRMAIYTLINGRSPKKPTITNIPADTLSSSAQNDVEQIHD